MLIENNVEKDISDSLVLLKMDLISKIKHTQKKNNNNNFGMRAVSF